VVAFVHPTSGETVWYLATGLSKPFFGALLAAFARQTGAGRRRHIVLVLDNAGWHGPEGLAVPDGISLVKFLEKREPLTPSPCLIILDINMPILNGKEAVKEIRQIEPYQEIPIVLFSTSSLPYDKKFAEKNNAGFLTKPLNTEQLARIAEQFLDYCAEDIRRNIQKKIL